MNSETTLQHDQKRKREGIVEEDSEPAFDAG